MNNPSGASTDFVSSIWYNSNILQKSGIRITFNPQIQNDINCYANVCYPEGFAFVFTSSRIDGNMGSSKSGLGYDGISNAVAIEFDFVQSLNKNDKKKPHVSVHSNVNGKISSTSPDGCTEKTLCNAQLPNFYVKFFF
jgi:hypothetical protein